jgi:enoyl-CoA hydratase/carnithine racemase
LSNEHLIVEREEGVLTLTLHDPPTRNALGPEMVAALNSELDEFDRNPEDRVLLLTGTEPSFCSGANVRRFNQSIEESPAEAGQTPDSQEGSAWDSLEAEMGKHRETDPGSGALMPLRLHRLQKPSIAAVNGYAIGVGMGLALACDVRLASEKAVFSEAFVRMGLVPGDGSCWQLPRLIGLSHTYLLQYTGDRLDGTEAHRIGLVSRVYPHDELMKSAKELALRMAQGATYAMSLTKYMVQKSLDMGLEESLDMAHAAQELARHTSDHREAVRAFLEKRKPRFTGT